MDGPKAVVPKTESRWDVAAKELEELVEIARSGASEAGDLRRFMTGDFPEEEPGKQPETTCDNIYDRMISAIGAIRVHLKDIRGHIDATH